MPQAFDRILLPSSSGINVSNPEERCEAFGCNKRATKQITISAGRHGNIDLNVCKRCISEFNDNDNDNNDEENRRSVSYQDTNQDARNHNPTKSVIVRNELRQSSR